MYDYKWHTKSLIHWDSSNSIHIKIIYIVCYMIFCLAYVCQIFIISMGVVLKLCTTMCNIIFKSSQLEIRNIHNFLSDYEIGLNTWVYGVVGFGIHLLPNHNCFSLQFPLGCSSQSILQCSCSLIWILFIHFQLMTHRVKLNTT